MAQKLIVSPSPHLHSGASTASLMRDVLIALAPAFLVSVWFYGLPVVWVTAVSVGACMLFEWAIQRFWIGGPGTLGNWSAALTGVLLAFNVPSSLPLWMVAVGALAAIGIGKMSFGGLGKNPFNPALVGRVFLLISFPVAMTSFPKVGAGLVADAATGATPLALAKEALKAGRSVSEILPDLPSYTDLLVGGRGGSLGEIAALALLLGFVYLLWRKVITWHIPVAVLGAMALFSGILWGVDPGHYLSPAFHLLTGGALLGAIFMATDYVTSPMNPRGMILYGVGIGVITMCIRTWGAYPEGMSFAILIMNAVVPLVNKYVKPRRFGLATK